MEGRDRERQLEGAIDHAAAECLKGSPTAAYAALAPFASDDVAKGNPPETSGEKGSGAAPGGCPRP
jgi:hypothetical protein